MKTLIGMVTFGNLPFTRLAIQSIKETTTEPVEFYVVVGKPSDQETVNWLLDERIPYVRHGENFGFPASINDLYDHAWNPEAEDMPWRTGEFDNLIVAGNDIVPYPGAIDALVRTARETDWEWLCSSQFDVKSLVTRYPETLRYFHGENLVFDDFTQRPWEAHEEVRKSELGSRNGDFIQSGALTDVRNLTLFKRSVFEKIGYADVNFWPGGYFEDNDYCKRANLAGVKAATLADSAYFHFWSRTIHQGGKGEEHHPQFRRNSHYYHVKWGGPFGHETLDLPFNGSSYSELAGLTPGTVKISGRSQEARMIEYWQGLKD